MGKQSKTGFASENIELKMYKFLIFLLCQSVISQDLTFEESPSAIQEGDVGTRFFNVNLGNFDLGGIGESVVGTVIGNAASGFINDCFGKRKRSIIMDRIVNKRSAQDLANGQVSGDDVNNRLFCLNNNNNNRPNCLICSCNRDYNCRNYCNKCRNNFGNNNNFGSSNNFGSTSSYFSCNNCNCNSDTRCYNTCDKCYSSNNNNYGNNYGSVNCNTCSCRSNSCFNTCRKCVNTNSFSSNVNCNNCSCRYDSNCRNRCNCYSYGNNNWWNGVRARNEGGQERPSFVDQGSTSSNNAGNQGFSSSSNQGSSSDAVVFA